MLSLVIVFGVAGILWFLGARYALANRRWFSNVLDRLARERGEPWEESSRLERARLFMGAAWKADSGMAREARLFTPSGDPEVEVARLEAVRRFRIYVKALSVFAGAVVVAMLVTLVVLGVHALTS